MTAADARVPYGRRAGDRAPMKIGIVGTGAMGSLHARVVSESSRARLYAVIDSDLVRATAIAEKIGCLASSDLEVAARCDAVIVATPTGTHRDVALPLLEAGTPLLIEKPLADDYQAVVEIVKQSEACGVPIQCGFVERFNPVVTVASEILEGTAVHLVGIRHSPPNVRASSSVVGDLLIHDIDLAVHFAGAAQAEEVVATTWRPAPDAVSEIADCTIRFSNGMVATLSSSRASQRKIRSLVVSNADVLVDLDLLRQNATVYRHVRHEQAGATYRAETVIDIPFVRQTGEPLALQFDNFMSLVRGVLDPDEERRRVLPAHEILSRIEQE